MLIKINFIMGIKTETVQQSFQFDTVQLRNTKPESFDLFKMTLWLTLQPLYN